jgi:Ser/Thr protein kinase RdoA (MazF antagonist)
VKYWQKSMKPFDFLTFRGQILRLRQLAIQALSEYPIDMARVRYLTTESTTMFRVDARDGSKYVLRLYSELDSSLAENETEMFWLTALARETDLHVTEPVARNDGSYLTFVRTDGVPVEKRCALYKWVPGVRLEKHVSPQTYRQLGSIMAKLHNHAESLTLPGHINPKRWDKVFYYPDEPVVYNTPEYNHLFTSEQIDIMERACQRLNPFLANLYQRGGRPMLVHADMHFWNVHIYRGELYVIDFEDILLGYPLHDIAICLYYLRDRADYPELAAAFEAGYAAERDWPSFTQSDLHLLWAARMTNFINYVAHVDEVEEAREFINTRCEELEKLL